MEQKKILWIILSVSLFVLVIFGVALFLYSPVRNQNAIYAGGETIPYEAGFHESSTVDPDQWARNPDKIAGLDKNAVPNMENVLNLTIIANEGAHNQSQDIDVSGLTNTAPVHTSETPKDLAEQIGINNKTEQNTQTMVREAPKKPKVEKEKPAQANAHAVTAIAKANTPIKKQQPAPKALVKPAPSKPQIQTLYWVQTASLASRLNAEKTRDTLAALHMKVEIFTKETASGVTYRVRVGPFNNNTEAHYWLKNIKKIKGFEQSYVTEEKVKR